MKVRTYRGKAIGQLLSQIKSELGDDPMIISTRQDADKSYEIRVGMQVEAASPGVDKALIRLSQPLTLDSDEIQFPAALDGSLEHILASHGLEKDLLTSILNRRSAMRSTELTNDRIIAAGLADHIEFESRLPLQKRCVALFGATGVGKTTTIAKLAARVRAAFDLSVGLIAADTYRVGAGFHLQSYASLMQLPFRMLDGRKDFQSELRAALNALRDCDLVLIDTAGCSPRETARINRMLEEYSAFPEVERMLVLPAPSNSVDLMVSAEQFRALSYERVIISKLDESGFIGPVINTVRKIGKPVAFMTTGQRVPEDIEPASARRLGWMLTQTMH